MAKKDENKSQAELQQDAGLVGQDHVLGEGTRIYPADLGYTKTSHGDGSPSIDEGLIEDRKADIERQANFDAQAEAQAKKLGLKK